MCVGELKKHTHTLRCKGPEEAQSLVDTNEVIDWDRPQEGVYYYYFCLGYFCFSLSLSVLFCFFIPAKSWGLWPQYKKTKKKKKLFGGVVTGAHETRSLINQFSRRSQGLLWCSRRGTSWSQHRRTRDLVLVRCLVFVCGVVCVCVCVCVLVLVNINYSYFIVRHKTFVQI